MGNSDDEEEIQKLIEGYRPQLDLYKEALEAIRGIKVRESYLYLFDIDKEILID